MLNVKFKNKDMCNQYNGWYIEAPHDLKNKIGLSISQCNVVSNMVQLGFKEFDIYDNGIIYEVEVL